MDVFWIVVILIGVIAVIVLASVNGLRGTGALQVEPRRLVTDRERRVIAMIEAAAPDCRVHAQVAMGALMDARKGLDRKRRTSIRNRFDRKIVDYVLEDKASGDVMAIVELDDRTHSTAKDKARDLLTSAAGYTTIRLPAGTGANPQLVRERISAVLLRSNGSPH